MVSVISVVPFAEGRCRPFFCLLALEIWAGRGARCARSGAQSLPSERRERPGRVCEPLGPERSVGRGLARSGPPATIGGPEGKKGVGSGRRGGLLSASPAAAPQPLPYWVAVPRAGPPRPCLIND